MRRCDLVRSAILLLVLCFASRSEAQGIGGAATGRSPAKVRVDVPSPSPQQLPGSSVLPAGADASAATYPNAQTASTDAGSESGEFVIAPIPFSNEAFSFGLIPVVQYVFHPDPNDKESP